MTSRPLPKAAIAGFILVVAAGAVLLWSSSSSSEGATTTGPRPTNESTSAAAPAPSGQAPTPQERKPPEEVLPISGCWDGLLAFDKAASMDNFRSLLAGAIAAQDRLLAVYLQERLTELVGDDPSRALQVIEWAANASQAELGVFMEALKAAPAVHRPEVAERLLKMGEDKGASLVHRAAALDTLDTQRKLSPAVMQRLKAIALDESSDAAGWVATRTLGRVMNEDYERTGNYGPYWKELMDISTRSEDAALRALALEMPSYGNIAIDSASIDKLGELMRKDPERSVREMAAFRLGVTDDPQKALETYKAAFDGEHDICVRWAILLYALRAAGQDAMPLVQEFATKDPRLQQDYQDFKELYASGTADFSRIWLGKQERHSCIMEEGAPH
jgi:hypothetical protein